MKQGSISLSPGREVKVAKGITCCLAPACTTWPGSKAEAPGTSCHCGTKWLFFWVTLRSQVTGRKTRRYASVPGGSRGKLRRGPGARRRPPGAAEPIAQTAPHLGR